VDGRSVGEHSINGARLLRGELCGRCAEGGASSSASCDSSWAATTRRSQYPSGSTSSPSVPRSSHMADRVEWAMKTGWQSATSSGSSHPALWPQDEPSCRDAGTVALRKKSFWYCSFGATYVCLRATLLSWMAGKLRVPPSSCPAARFKSWIQGDCVICEEMK